MNHLVSLALVTVALCASALASGAGGLEARGLFGGHGIYGGGYKGAYGPYGLYFSFLDPYFQGVELTQPAAANVCRSRGMRLVSLDDPFKDQLVQSYLHNFGVKWIWTSGYRYGYNFVWGNGKPIGYGYTNWSRTGQLGYPQPDNAEGNEQCVAMLNNFYRDGIVWHDIGCHHKKAFVCEPAYYH